MQLQQRRQAPCRGHGSALPPLGAASLARSLASSSARPLPLLPHNANARSLTLSLGSSKSRARSRTGGRQSGSQATTRPPLHTALLLPPPPSLSLSLLLTQTMFILAARSAASSSVRPLSPPTHRPAAGSSKPAHETSARAAEWAGFESPSFPPARPAGRPVRQTSSRKADGARRQEEWAAHARAPHAHARFVERGKVGG